MTTETPVTQETTQTTTTPTDLGSLSFADYQKVRRGGELPKVEANKSAPEAKASEQKKEATDSETDATEETESETAEKETQGAESEKSDTAEGEETQAAKAKKKGGIQKRFDKLSKEKSELQREAEYWKKAALEKGASDPKQSQTVETKSASKTSDDKPNPEKFDTHAEYVEALTDWKVDQKEKSRELKEQQKQAESEQMKALGDHAKRVESFKSSHDDFEDVMENLSDVPRSPALEQAIVNSEHGPEILYELGKNPIEAKRIAGLPPIAAAMEIGKIEARLASKTSEAKTETKKLTKAPDPIDPIGGSKGTVRKSISDPDLSFTDYVRMRRDSLRKRA